MNEVNVLLKIQYAKVITEWQPIETAPQDGTKVDLWMRDMDGSEYREANAFYVKGWRQEVIKYDADGNMKIETITRDGWAAPNHNYGDDGFCDEPSWFNPHPNQNKWVGVVATHWMPIPLSPTEVIRKVNSTNEPDPCYFCGEPAFLETCDHPQCNCGFRWLGCLNDACPVQPHIDNNDIATAEEALAVWNGYKAKSEKSDENAT